MRKAASVIAFLLVLYSASGQHPSQKEPTTKDLTVELRTNSNRVSLANELLVSVFFRSTERTVTIWNALGWNSSTGLYLLVFDASGHEVTRFAEMYDVLPPNQSGQGALISIGGNSFAGFDSHIPVKSLFPAPGKYTLRCIYSPQLPRDYFQGTTIWGNEDGQIESTGVTVIVK